jgi:hypothetical protein
VVDRTSEINLVSIVLAPFDLLIRRRSKIALGRLGAAKD